jgi:hypothetical protein
MSKVPAEHGLRSNRLLGALEPASRKRLDPLLEPIDFKLGEMVCDAGGCSSTRIFRKDPSCRC